MSSLSLSLSMAGAPFVKVEATKYTEVGFHGKDVDTMIKDLVDVAINLQRNKMKEAVKAEVSAAVENRILDILAGDAAQTSTRESFRALLREGALDERTIEVELPVNNGNKAAGGPVIRVCVCVCVRVCVCVCVCACSLSPRHKYTMCIQNVFRNCIVITFNQCFSRFSNTIVVIEKLEHYYFVLLFF
jgi:hypothetical protein